jgi:RNA-binding protein YlmH
MTKKVDTTGLADELGIIRAKMADLKDREKEIREIMLEAGEKAFEDKKFRAVVVESLRTYIDWKTVAEKLNPSRQLVTAHTTEKDVVSIRVNARRGALI